MTPERWRQIEALFHQVVDLPAGDRRVLLDQADSEVRREVESMLAADGSLPERPAPEGETETIAAGARLGPYQLERLIGSGGMGQVFRARDTRLNRAVAIKISAEGFGERFEREARS